MEILKLYATGYAMLWILLLIIDAGYFGLWSSNFDLYYKFRKKMKIRHLLYFTDLYLMIEKYANNRRKHIIRFSSYSRKWNNIDMFYKFNFEKIKDFILGVVLTPFRLSLNNFLIWTYVIGKGGYYNNAKLIIVSIRIYIDNNKVELLSYLDVLIKYQAVIYLILGLVGVSKIYKFRIGYHNFYHDQIGYYRRCQNKMIVILSEIYHIQYKNLCNLDDCLQYMNDAYIESITGVSNYSYENGELKFCKSNSFDCLGLSDYKNRFKDWDEYYNKILLIINELHENNEWEYFSDANYYNKYEFLKLFIPANFDYFRNSILDGRYLNELIDNHNIVSMSFFEENIYEIAKHKRGDTLENDELSQDIEFYEERLLDKVEKFEEKMNRNIYSGIENHLLLKRYLDNYYRYHNNPLVHDMFYIAKKVNLNYATR